MNYCRKITFALNEPYDVIYVNNVCNMYPNEKILVEVQNTKGISSLDIRKTNNNVDFRIVGGYDERRVKLNKNSKYKSGETGDYYFSSVIYSKNETIKIVEKLEQIEKNINENWGKIQKLVYIFTYLKKSIMYDPKYEKKTSNEIRTLRGLITKQTVCAGYSIILKEILDRQQIECEYVEGKSHAWNIVTIEGKKYPVDLTWSSSLYRRGTFNVEEFLAQDVKGFIKRHKPLPGELTQDYEKTLSELNPEMLKKINRQFQRSSVAINSTFLVPRKDGTEFIVSQIGTDGKYFRYFYIDMDNPNEPQILFSKTNLMKVNNAKKYNDYIPEGYENAAINILFSKQNIADSLRKKINYIGDVLKKDRFSNKNRLITCTSEIDKPDSVSESLTFPTRNFKRSDGSAFVIQQMLDKPFKVKNINLMRYDIYEFIIENGNKFVKRDTVYTERNLFLSAKQDDIDNYLGRKRLNEKSQTSGGYIGAHTSGVTNLASYFRLPNISDKSAAFSKETSLI